MSVHLIAVTATGGVPLFSRQIGDEASSIPYATLAALNGVNMFSRLNGANLMTTVTKNGRIHWRIYSEIVLIMIVKCDPDDTSTLRSITGEVVDSTLDYIYDGFIMTCGAKEISKTNVDRLKKSLRNSFALVDHLLRTLLNESNHVSLFYQVNNYLNVDESTEQSMKVLVDNYSTISTSDFSCLIVNSSVVCASKGWWTRLSHSRDSFLLVNYVNSLPSDFFEDVDSEEGCKVKMKEVSIFLPENEPDSVTRLVVINLYLNVKLILLLGEIPSLDELKSSSLPIYEMMSSMIYQHQFKMLSTLQENRSFCLLPIDERISNLFMIKHDVNVTLRYGHFVDANRKQELISVLNVLCIKKKGQEAIEEFVKLSHSLIYKTTAHKVTLIICVPRDLSLTTVKSIAMKTISILKDKKLLPQINHK